MVVESRAELCVFVGREPAHGYPDRELELGELRQMSRDEAVNSRIREADRVQHPDVRLGDADRRVAVPRERRDGLRHEAVERCRDLGRGEGVEAAACIQEKQRTGPSTQRRLRTPSISIAQP